MQSTKQMPQRRPERLLGAAETFEVIKASEYAYLSTCDTEGNPYGVPVSPVFVNGVFYFHTTAEEASRRNTNMTINPRVSLCFVSKAFTLPDMYSVDYASAIVSGTVCEVTDPTERASAMMAIVKRYAPENSAERNAVQLKHRFALAKLWRITPEKITGKARAAKKWVSGKTVKELTLTETSPWLVGVH